MQVPTAHEIRLSALKNYPLSSTLGKSYKEFDEYGINSFPSKGKERLSDEGARIKELESQLLDKELDLGKSNEIRAEGVRSLCLIRRF